MKKFLLMTIMLFLSNTIALADDAIEGAPSSNITFEAAPELIMQDETLTITKSAGKVLGSETFTIDVDFHFKNISNHDVIRKIAFVLPPVQCREDAASIWRGIDSKINDDNHVTGLKDFKTQVDGKNQPYTVRTEAFLGKRNITNLLADLHLPENPCDIKMGNNGMPDPEYGDVLTKNHLLAPTNDPAWRQNIYFEWTQTFPAGKTINIHHRYTPVVGEAVLAKRSIREFNQILSGRHSGPQKAIWNADLSSVSNKDEYCVMPMWLEYHLTTGAYWRGGIGEFKLILKDEAGSPFAINQFYKRSGAVQITKNDKTLTFIIKHFIPTKNLRILYLVQPHNAEERKMCGD